MLKLTFDVLSISLLDWLCQSKLVPAIEHIKQYTGIQFANGLFWCRPDESSASCTHVQGVNARNSVCACFLRGDASTMLHASRDMLESVASQSKQWANVAFMGI